MRFLMGFVCLALGIVLSLQLTLAGVPAVWRLATFPLFFTAALGFLQAKRRTCVALAVCGLRNFDTGNSAIDDPEEKKRLKGEAAGLLARAFLVGATVSAVLTLCPGLPEASAAPASKDEIFQVLSQNETLRYDWPKGWAARPTRDPETTNFEIPGKVSEKSVSGFVRSFRMPGYTAGEWASDERLALKKKTRNAVGPEEVKFGANAWQRLSWEEDVRSDGKQVPMQVFQYFLKGRVTMAEVKIGGPKEAMAANQKALEKLLAGARLEAGSGHATYRPCGNETLRGEWEMVRMASAGTPSKGAFSLPHQRFWFGEEGKMKSASSAKPLDEAGEKAWQEYQAATDYEVLHSGELTTRAPGAENAESAFCAELDSDTPPAQPAKAGAAYQKTIPKKGDVILAYPLKNGTVGYAKLLRKRPSA